MKKRVKKYLGPFLFIQFFTLNCLALDNIPFAEYIYNGKNCFSIRYTSGSLIFIPEDAFTPACTGTIKIKYREMHSKVDMLEAGINMIYEENGKRRMLESAGMFEIYAECNGKPLELAPNKTIQVRMRCKRNFPQVEAFVYDKKKNIWGKAGIPVVDFSYLKNNNNKDNTSMWGSSSRGGNYVMNDSLENMLMVTSIIGTLPDGYIKGMNIKTMGLYNYDYLYHDEKAVPIMASFKLTTGETISEAYVAYRSINSLIHYFAEDYKEKFVLLPVKGISIFCIFKDGSCAIMDQKKLDALDISALKNKEYEFILEKQPAKPKNKNELAKALRID